MAVFQHTCKSILAPLNYDYSHNRGVFFTRLQDHQSNTIDILDTKYLLKFATMAKITDLPPEIVQRIVNLVYESAILHYNTISFPRNVHSEVIRAIKRGSIWNDWGAELRRARPLDDFGLSWRDAQDLVIVRIDRSIRASKKMVRPRLYRVRGPKKGMRFDRMGQ